MRDHLVITGPFWKNSLQVLELPPDLPPVTDVRWLIEVLHAANSLTSREATLVDADDLDHPTSELPDVHVQVDVKDFLEPLRVTCWSMPIPEDGTVLVEIKNHAGSCCR
ncbi:hypothetical protein [Ferrimonas kyonanensis]|uniref:hypothetical protein n=1 Tax=Ferrimonas kyonanensis TaxID=364763 RepID=UPI0004825902|nr:hypothetical protein [Ferrimonas kyonanensis]